MTVTVSDHWSITRYSMTRGCYFDRMDDDLVIEATILE